MRLRRKLAIATWGSPSEGNIYGKLTLDVTEALRYIDHLRETTGEKITLTHLIGKALGEVLKREPTLNGRIFLGKYRPHESVDVCFVVAMKEGTDLGKATLRGVDKKSVVDIARELRERAENLRNDKDESHNRSQGPLRWLPTWLLRPLISITGYLTGSAGLNAKWLGLESFPFGGCIVTNVGGFGVDEAFVPPVPFAYVPLYVLIGAVRDGVAVQNGAVVVRKQVTLTSTIDHRFVDGYQCAILAKTLREFVENPWSIDTAAPAQDRMVATPAAALRPAFNGQS